MSVRTSTNMTMPIGIRRNIFECVLTALKFDILEFIREKIREERESKIMGR